MLIKCDYRNEFHYFGVHYVKKKSGQVTSIKNWINTKNKKCLVVQGARQTGKTYIIEVKGGNTRANSLKSLMKNHKDISYGYKFADGNIGVDEDGIITLPLYMVAFI